MSDSSNPARSSDAVGISNLSPTRMDLLWLRFALGFIWLATGLGVLHPYYRVLGREYLALVGAPAWMMEAACGMEVLLGLRVILGPMASWLAIFQIGLITFFTLMLSSHEPTLLVHPFGVLTKNLPLIALVATLWLLEREGWSLRTRWILRVGMALVWLTEGLLPVLLFPSDILPEVLTRNGLTFLDPRQLLPLIGIFQVALFVGTVLARGWLLRLLVGLQILGLLGVCLVVTRYDPLLWVHTLGPLTKNIPILLGNVVVWRRCA